MYSNINHKYVQQERTIYNSPYCLANSKLQLNYDLEELYRTNDWKSINSHKGELVIAYDNKVWYKTLHPTIFHALYIRPNDVDNWHPLYILSTDQIIVTKEYQSVPVSNDLFETMNDTRSYDNRIQVIHLKDDYSTVQDNHSSKYNKECHTHINDSNGSEDKSQDESDRPSQLNSMDSNKIVNQGYKILLPMGPGKIICKC